MSNVISFERYRIKKLTKCPHCDLGRDRKGKICYMRTYREGEVYNVCPYCHEEIIRNQEKLEKETEK